MPIFVSRNTPNPTPAESMPSPDGILTATVDGGGVFLEADFSRIIDGIPEKIIATNFYPDPEHHYGTGLFTSPPSGTGTLELDNTVQHMGHPSIKMTNTTPRTVAATNYAPYGSLEAYTGSDGVSDGWTITNYDGASGTGMSSQTFSRPDTFVPGATGKCQRIQYTRADASAYRRFQSSRFAIPASRPDGLYFRWDYIFASELAGDRLTFTGYFYDADDNNLGTFNSFGYGTATLAPTSDPTAATTHVLASQIPAAATQIIIWFDTIRSGNEPIGKAIDYSIDRFAITTSPMETYFDGDSPPDPFGSGYTYAWTGPANASTSQQLAAVEANLFKAGLSPATPADMGCELGDPVTVACWVQIPTGSDPYGSNDYVLGLYGTAFDSAQYASIDNTRGSFVRITATQTVTSLTGSINPRIFGGARSDDVTYHSDFVIIRGTADDLPDVFSGDDAPSGDVLYRWVGTPGDSASEQYTAEVDPTEDPNNRLKKVRFVRLPDQAVRSGDSAWAPRGRAVAYDDEAPLGVAATWIAYPVFKDGTLGTPSQGVSITTGTPDNPYDSWIKSTVRPELSVRVFVTKDGLPEFTWEARTNLSAVQGSPYPAGAVDEFTAPSPTFTCYTETPEDAQALETLLTSGREFLFQTLPEYNLRDFYFVPGSFTMSLTGAGVASDSRKWSIPMTTIARPTTVDSPLVIPGRSYDDRADQFASYDVLGASFPDYESVTAPQ